jgi:hypothetical protein
LLTKKTKEHEQTVRDTVRSTDVDVEEVEPRSVSEYSLPSLHGEI